MRAWQVTKYGRPSEALELVDVPDPTPYPGEIVVRTTASVLNYNEVDGCHGRYLTINPPLPYTLGMECVGEVIAAGPGAESWIGKRVTASGRGATGAHAEVAVGPTAMAFEAPEQLDDAEAAAFFYPFHLAHLGLFERGRVQAGETVLVHAAAGGVGSAAVQLAVAAGARVIATCSGAEKAAVVKGLGADVVIEAEEVPMISGRAFCFGNFDVVGVILAYRDPAWGDGELPVPVPVPRFNAPTTEVGQRVQAHLLELLGAGRIKPIVGQRVPFEQLPQALDEMESRATIGRVVIDR